MSGKYCCRFSKADKHLDTTKINVKCETDVMRERERERYRQTDRERDRDRETKRSRKKKKKTRLTHRGNRC